MKDISLFGFLQGRMPALLMNYKLLHSPLQLLFSVLLPLGNLQANSKPATATAVPPFTPPGGSLAAPLHRIIGFNDAGEMLALSHPVAAGDPQRLVTGRSGDLKVVAAQGQAVPGSVGLVFGDDLANTGSLGQDGRVAFHARIGASAQATDGGYGLFLWQDQALSTVLLPNSPVPGISYSAVSPATSSYLPLTGSNPLFFHTRWTPDNGGTFGAICSYPPLTALNGTISRLEALPVANARGDVFYNDSAWDDTHPNPGLRRWRSGQVTLIAGYKTTSPTGFAALELGRCNAAGDVAYVGTWTDSTNAAAARTEFWHWREGQNRLMMRLGDPVPGLPNTTFSSTAIKAMTDDGAVIFITSLEGEHGGTGILHWKDGQMTVIAREFMIPDGAPGMSGWFPLRFCTADNGAVVIAAQDGNGGQGDKGLWYWEPGLPKARLVCMGNPPRINIPGQGLTALQIDGNTLSGDLNVGSNSGVCGLLNRNGELALGSASIGLPYALILNVRTLAIGTPPVIVTGPEEAVTTTGGNSTFSVTTGGTTPQVFQWLKNGEPVPGATSNTLTLSNVTLADNGSRYVVVVDNALGSVTSQAAALTVLAPEVVALTRVIKLSGSLAFGDVAVGLIADRTLLLENKGNRTLTVTGIHWPPAFTGDWNGGTIPPGISQPIKVAFAPQKPGAFGGAVTVDSDRTSGVSTVICSGIGAEGEPLTAGTKPAAVTPVLPFTPPDDPNEAHSHEIIGLNDSGELLARSYRVPNTNLLITGKPGSLKVIAAQDQPVLGADGLVLGDDLANYGSLGQDGRVAFNARIETVPPTQGKYALFHWNGTALSTVLLPQSSMPGITSAFVDPRPSMPLILAGGLPLRFLAVGTTLTNGDFGAIGTYPPLATIVGGTALKLTHNLVGNARGDVFYNDSTWDETHPNPGIGRWRDGQITPIAKYKISESTGYIGLNAERSNASGDLAYKAVWTNGTITEQRFYHWREGEHRLVMRQGEAVPGLADTSYGGGEIMAVTDDGAVIFRSNLAGNQGGNSFLHWKDGAVFLIAQQGKKLHGAPEMDWYPLRAIAADNGAVVFTAQNGGNGQGMRGLWYWEPGLSEPRTVCVGDPAPKINVAGYGPVSVNITGNTLNGDLGVGSNSGVCGILNRHGKLALGSSNTGLPYGVIVDVRTLALGTPPAVIQAPQNASVARNGNHTFHVTTEGTTPQVFQWLKNEQPIPGATGSTLTLTEVPFAENGGSYAVVIENALGTITSTSAVLTVREPAPAEWRDQYFSPAELVNAAVSGPAADADGDGTANLVEFVLGRDPRDPEKKRGFGTEPGT